jgi:hypothetical protein
VLAQFTPATRSEGNGDNEAIRGQARSPARGASRGGSGHRHRCHGGRLPRSRRCRHARSGPSGLRRGGRDGRPAGSRGYRGPPGRKPGQRHDDRAGRGDTGQAETGARPARCRPLARPVLACRTCRTRRGPYPGRHRSPLKPFIVVARSAAFTATSPRRHPRPRSPAHPWLSHLKLRPAEFIAGRRRPERAGSGPGRPGLNSSGSRRSPAAIAEP